jgi:hypothetical protein
MKRFIIALTALFTITVSTSAMSYEQACQQALFLTDKMAYELNLTDDQYEAAYEINLDYLMGVNTYEDVAGIYWRNRNLDLSYVLLDWQYSLYLKALYFYRPLYYDGGYWHFRIYARYPHRTYYYFGRPGFYATYRGGHAWHMNGGRSWYHGRSYATHHHSGSGRSFSGMRDRYDNRSHNHGSNIRRDNGIRARSGNSDFSGRRSSTRETVNNMNTTVNSRNFGSSSNHSNGTFSGNRSMSNTSRVRSTNIGGTFRGSAPRGGSSSSMGSGSSNGGSSSRSFGGASHSSSGSSHSSGGFTGRR